MRSGELSFDQRKRLSGYEAPSINKVETAVQLRFDVRNSPSLPERVKGSKGRRLDSKAKRGAVKSLRRDKPGQE